MYDNLTRTELEFAYREAEKRIAELEDERSDLDMIAKNYAIKIANLKKSCDETQELLDKQIEATYKLVEENAELKKQQFSLRNERNTFLAQNEQYEKDLIDFKENLTKAKFLLKQLVDAFPKSYSDVVKDTLDEAEQFLNSEVEK